MADRNERRISSSRKADSKVLLREKSALGFPEANSSRKRAALSDDGYHRMGRAQARVESRQGDFDRLPLALDDKRLNALDLIETGVYEPPCRFARDQWLAFGQPEVLRV